MSRGDGTPVPDAVRADLWRALVRELLEAWYPGAIDREHGGFHESLTMEFEPRPEQWRELIVQARHVWTTSRAASLIDDDARYAEAAEHGYRYLRDVWWDREYGGFRRQVYAHSSDGVWPGSGAPGAGGFAGRVRDLIPRNRASLAVAGRLGLRQRPAGPPMPKETNGQAFGVFALAAYHGLTGSEAALDLARETFAWLEAHAHDAEHGGYLSFLGRDGTPLLAGPGDRPPKDFNTILHVVEAFTELYRVWPDALLRERLVELVDLVCERMVHPRGTGWTTFEVDWTPVRLNEPERGAGAFEREHISFGHDIETAALLTDAVDVLELDEAAAPRGLARRMAEHSLEQGWDEEHGGLFLAGYYDVEDGPCTVVDRSKVYWVQAETLNSLGLLASRLPDDEHEYGARFLEHWEYCRRHMIDGERGGWFFRGLDDLALSEQPGKGRPIHGTYHVGRALMNSWTRLGR